MLKERCLFDVRLLRRMQGKCGRRYKGSATADIAIRRDQGDYVCDYYDTPIYTPVQCTPYQI